MLGVQVDPQVGPVVLLGLGGIYVEVFEDVALRPAPLSEADVDEMLAELRSLPLLSGARGRPPADLAALRQAVLAVARLALALGPSLAELDLNPLLVLSAEGGALAVDAVVVRSTSATPSKELQ
jgi:acyl-CoA synthetase (NDP forming)